MLSHVWLNFLFWYKQSCDCLYHNCGIIFIPHSVLDNNTGISSPEIINKKHICPSLMLFSQDVYCVDRVMNIMTIFFYIVRQQEVFGTCSSVSWVSIGLCMD